MPRVVSGVVEGLDMREADTPNNNQTEHGSHHGTGDGFRASTKSMRERFDVLRLSLHMDPH